MAVKDVDSVTVGPWSDTDSGTIAMDVETELNRVWSDSRLVLVPDTMWLPVDDKLKALL